MELGVTHVELMPVNEFSGKWGWGYDGVDLYAPHHAYGAPDDLKELVNACHAKNLAVLLDVVYNHLGPIGNYLNSFGPYFTDAYNTPWGPAVNLDHKGSYEVRRFFLDNALMWLRDYHFDGLRLDAIHAFVDRSAVHLLENLSAEVDALSSQLGRHLVLIAESDLNDPRVVTCREAGGFGMDAQWSDDFHHCLHTILTGERNGYYEEFGSYAQLAKAMKHAFVFDGIYSPHRERLHGRPGISIVGPPFSGVFTKSRSGWKPGARRALEPDTWRGQTENRGGSSSHVSFRSDAVSRRGIRGVNTVPILHAPRRSRTGPEGIGRPAQ